MKIRAVNNWFPFVFESDTNLSIEIYSFGEDHGSGLFN